MLLAVAPLDVPLVLVAVLEVDELEEEELAVLLAVDELEAELVVLLAVAPLDELLVPAVLLEAVELEKEELVALEVDEVEGLDEVEPVVPPVADAVALEVDVLPAVPLVVLLEVAPPLVGFELTQALPTQT